MKFAKIVYRVAGIYGVLVLFPLYFLEGRTGRVHPPAITHPEFYYGFTGVALAWQFVFLVMSRDPVKYRALMIPSMLEKLGFGAAVFILYVQNRLGSPVLVFATTDLILLVLFAAAFQKTALHA
jgi:hypothetical protein